MDWGRKNSPSSSTFPSLSRVSMSWFSFFKQIGKRPMSRPVKDMHKPKPGSPLRSTSALKCEVTAFVGEDHNDDEDSYWHFSFGEASPQSRKSTTTANSVSYDSLDEFQVPLSSAKGDALMFTDMVSDARKMRNLGSDVRERSPVRTPRGRTQKGRQSIKMDSRVVREVFPDSGKESDGLEQKNKLDLKVTDQKPQNMSCEDLRVRNSHKLSSPTSKHTGQRRRKTKEEGEHSGDHDKLEIVFEEEEGELEQKTSKDMEIMKILLESDKHRKSVYINREVHKRRAKQSCKVKVHSPRTPTKTEIRKIRSLKDMKNAKMKKTESFENFAVVKCSFDPQKDFKNSMAEMIADRHIRQPEELENLLACYLSLNSDEHHDIIVKVFRQVWVDMNRLSSSIKLLKNNRIHD